MNEWRVDSNTIIVHIKQSLVLFLGYYSSSSNNNNLPFDRELYCCVLPTNKSSTGTVLISIEIDRGMHILCCLHVHILYYCTK